MHVLVTGGCGYVGSHAARELTASGHEVVLYDNLSTGHRRFAEGYEFIEADIADEVRLAKALEKTDAVMHFAASAYVGESVTNPRKYFRNNVESALKLLDAVLTSDVRLSSSRHPARPTEFRKPCRSPSRFPKRPSILMGRPNCFSNTRSLPMQSRMDYARFRCVTSMLPVLMPGDASVSSMTRRRI